MTAAWLPAELVRAIRFMIAAEYEAIQLYMQLAESTDHALAIDVLTDIADEERVHVGELLRLLSILTGNEDEFYKKGTLEVDTMAGKLGAAGAAAPAAKEESTIGALKTVKEA